MKFRVNPAEIANKCLQFPKNVLYYIKKGGPQYQSVMGAFRHVLLLRCNGRYIRLLSGERMLWL